MIIGVTLEWDKNTPDTPALKHASMHGLVIFASEQRIRMYFEENRRFLRKISKFQIFVLDSLV